MKKLFIYSISLCAKLNNLEITILSKINCYIEIKISFKYSISYFSINLVSNIIIFLLLLMIFI